MAEESNRAPLSLPKLPRTLESQYEIDPAKVLGRGGYATVWLAVHCITGEKAALKVMDKMALRSEPGGLHSVRMELAALRDLSNVPFVASLLQVEETPTHIFLVLEHVGNGDLCDYCEAASRVPPAKCRKIISQLAMALAGIHARGYAVRDLKPDNVMLTQGMDVRLIDLGLATHATDSQPYTQSVCGTRSFTAPEIIAGKPYRASAADMWGLGVLLYSLMSGALPFPEHEDVLGAPGVDQGALPTEQELEFDMLLERLKRRQQFQVPPWCSPECTDLLLKLLQFRPSKRPTADELLRHPYIQCPKSEAQLQKEAHDVCLQNLQKVARAHAVDPTTWVKYFDACHYDAIRSTTLLPALAQLQGRRPQKLGKGKLLPQLPPLESYVQNYANIDSRLRQFEVSHVIRRDISPEVLMAQSPTRTGRARRQSGRLSRSRFSVLSSRNTSVNASRRDSVANSRRDSVGPSHKDSHRDSLRSSQRDSAAASRAESGQPSRVESGQPSPRLGGRSAALPGKTEAWAAPAAGASRIPQSGSTVDGADNTEA